MLLVEDDLALSTVVSGVLEEAGYQPVAIADHALIASAVERWRPRCVILDGAVPAVGAGPWDDMIALRRDHPTLPVLMFTADVDALAEEQVGTSERSRAAHFAGSVGKPFLIEDLLGALRTAMPGSPRLTILPRARPAPILDGAVRAPSDRTGRSVADAGRADFVSSTVHELRQPLTVIRAQMQLAQRRVGRDLAGERRSIELAIAQVDRMTRMIAEVLEYSGLAADTFGLKVVGFDLVSAAAQAVERHSDGESVRIRLGHPGAPRADVRGDPGRIAQILDNLLVNALKYSAPGTPVGVTVTVADGEAMVHVKDHGVGVPDDERTRLFTPYYRTSLTRQIPGTGLGLNISRLIAKRHGGRLWLESSSSAGSVFALALPLAPSDTHD